MHYEFRQNEQLTRDELRFEAWVEEAEGLTGMNLQMSDDALLAFYDGVTPREFNDMLVNAEYR